MTKRTFFKRAMAMVACVALAPEIAFGVRLPQTKLVSGEFTFVEHKHPATLYDTLTDQFYVFREGKWVESGFAGQD